MSKWLISACFAMVLTFSLTTSAEAKIILFGFGDSIKELKPLPPDGKKLLQAIAKLRRMQKKAPSQLTKNAKIGYKYSYFSLFFLDVWTWNGDFVVYENNTFLALTAKRAKMFKIDLAGLKKPITYRFPPGMIVISVLLLGFVLMSIFGKDEESEGIDLSAIAGDERYQQALQLYHDELTPEDEGLDLSETDAYRLAIQHLQANDIPTAEAEGNFLLLLIAAKAGIQAT